MLHEWVNAVVYYYRQQVLVIVQMLFVPTELNVVDHHHRHHQLIQVPMVMTIELNEMTVNAAENIEQLQIDMYKPFQLHANDHLMV
jgi:hypothetical protein